MGMQLGYHSKGRIQIEGVWEQDAEENVRPTRNENKRGAISLYILVHKLFSLPQIIISKKSRRIIN
jgi:hypothetical protein